MIYRGHHCFGLLIAAVSIGGAFAEETVFASSNGTMNWLARELPRATAENPDYVTKSDGTVSQWLTKTIRFSHEADGRLSVSMDESYTQTKAGVSTLGRHHAAFLLADVEIGEFTEPGDVTAAGAPSRGILFRCKEGDCVSAEWSGKSTSSTKTDISIQDDVSRAKILAAFRYLQSHKS